MREAISVLIRQLSLVGGTYLVSTGKMDQSMVEPLIGLSLALGSVFWMIYDRFVATRKAK